MKIKFRESKDKELIVSNDEENHRYEEQLIQQKTDIGEAITNINEDNIQDKKFSSMDMKSRLSPLEINGILAFDCLVSQKFIPLECIDITRSKKRLSVSKNGAGRRDILDIVSGSDQRSERRSGWNKFFGLGGQ